MKIDILQGHTLNRLKEQPNESVHIICTSPPYWGLRSYGTEPQVWGGDSKCEHKWGKRGPAHHPGQVPDSKAVHKENAVGQSAGSGQFCSKCGAWKGHLGLEPTVSMYVQHVVEICREAWRVLREDGTLWMVLGDSYAGGGRAGKNPEYMKKHTNFGKTTKNVGKYGLPTLIPEGLKAKDLVMQPERIAWALQADGWYLRDRICWAKGISFCDSYSGSCMPESITDRCTSAFEFVYMFTKGSRYFYDNESNKEAEVMQPQKRILPRLSSPGAKAHGQLSHRRPEGGTGNGYRNLRNVWAINPANFNLEMCTACERIYKGAEYRKLKTVETDGKKYRVCRCGEHDRWLSHFAVFPEALIEPMIKAGTSEHGCCPKCAAPYKRVIRRNSLSPTMQDGEWEDAASDKGITGTKGRGGRLRVGLDRKTADEKNPGNLTIGWMPTCDCYLPGQSGWPKLPKVKDTKKPTKAEQKKIESCWRKRLKLVEQYKEHPVEPCVVMDIFVGSGTSGVVAAKLGRDFIGIDLNPHYCKLAKKRIRMAVTGLSTKEVKQGQKVMFEQEGLF